MSLLPKHPVEVEETISCQDCASRRHAWFKQCTANDLHHYQIFRTSQNTLAAGEYLFMEGDTPTSAYTLQDGWAICFKTLSNGQRQVLSVAFSGDYLGYRTNMNEPIDYSVMAVKDCRICSFSEKNIRQLLAKNPELIQSLFSIQETQANACRTRLTYVGQAPAKLKLAYFLVNILDKLKDRGIDIQQNIEFPLTHEDVADAIGITSVHMCRIAVELRRSNIVDCRHNHIRVMDFDALNKLATSVF